MNKIQLLISALVLAISSAHAQSGAFECRSSVTPKEGQTVLDNVQKTYGQVKSLKADFLQNAYLSALEQSEASSGKVWFQKPGKMKWHYTDPEEQIFVVKDSSLWLYQPLDNQVILDELKKVLISDLPVAFLMGLGDIKNDFTLSSSCRNEDGVVLMLKPKGGQGDLREFGLLVDTKTNLPRGALITDISKNRNAIILDAIETNSEISQSDFSTSFGRGVDVIDRRVESHG